MQISYRSVLFLFGCIGMAIGLGFAKVAVQGIVDPNSVHIFQEAAFF